MLPLIFLIAVLNTDDVVQKSDSQLTLFCNVTSPCIPCSPHRRHDAICSSGGTHQKQIACVAAEKEPLFAYEFRREASLRELVEGQVVEDKIACDMDHHWSLLRFELLLIFLLGASVLVMRWRHHRLW